MPAFHAADVLEVIETRAGLQKLRVQVDGRAEPQRAYALTATVGTAEVGDTVIVNTTAVDLSLGTGGWHFVHWNLARRSLELPGGGHIMKARYTSIQSDVGAAEEHHTAAIETVTSIDGMPVVVACLHSQVAAILAAIRHADTGQRVAYVMTDGAALPIALSDLVVAMHDAGWLHTTVTAGHAFGGDYEAVNIWSALCVARHIAGADIAVVAPGPGVVGTGTSLGTTGAELGMHLDAVGALDGRAIATLRASHADPRPRHYGLSHHSVTALRTIAQRRATLAVPAGDFSAELQSELATHQIDRRHDVVVVDAPDALPLFETIGYQASSMGRPAAADPILFDCASAAGALAAHWCNSERNDG